MRIKNGKESQRLLKNLFSRMLIVKRDELGYTQEYMAEICDVTLRTYQGWEYGDLLPASENLIYLAKVLNISIDEFIETVCKYGFLDKKLKLN